MPPRSSPSSAFFQGAKAAIPVWIAFVPASFSLGIAAKVYGLSLGEIVLMSALVYAGPAQFAALEPLASGRPAVQILLTTFLINLRFLVMSSALAPYFRRAKRTRLFFSIHFLSASSFLLPYTHFQKQAEVAAPVAGHNLRYFLGVALTSFSVWVSGSAFGYLAALRVPAGFEEILKFILPGYFACLLAVEVRGRTARAVVLLSVFAAGLGMLWDAVWGWLILVIIVGSAAWGVEAWIRRDSPSS